MASVVKNPDIEIKRYHICTKGEKHAEQPLNMVCLDPICRDDPLICPTCFSEQHKYHKTMMLGELLSDYQGAINRNHKNSLLKRIKKEHQNVTHSILEFKSSFNQKLDHYESSIQEFFQYLYSSLDIRNELQKTLKINLQPQKILQCCSQNEIQASLSFIINNSLFNQQNRIVNVSNILKCNQSRTLALMDKIVNENFKHQRDIEKQLEKLNFSSDTLKKQSIRIQSLVKEFNLIKSSQYTPKFKINVNSKAFIEKQTFYTTLKNNYSDQGNKTQTLIGSKVHQFFSIEKEEKGKNKKQVPIFAFSKVYKHQNLDILDDSKQSIIKSNVTAIKPQYALICPSVDYQPLREQNWSIKIRSCRNFASSKNTIAVGLCLLNEAINGNFEQKISENPIGKYLITSEGLLIKDGREERCDFSYIEGDVLNLKYDPYYKLLTVKKENGRKISMKIKKDMNDQNGKLFACVRLTYASDQVQLLNHARGTHY